METQMFLKLKSFSTPEEATISVWLGETLEHPLVYETMIYAQAILVRHAFRWFAGYTQDQLETLRTTRAVHPNILPRVKNGRFCLHDINMLHMKGHKVKWQKFNFLAVAGEIVYKSRLVPAGVSTQPNPTSDSCWL